MKIRILSSREEINSVRPNERAIHLAFRASNVDFLNLLQKALGLFAVVMPWTKYIHVKATPMPLPANRGGGE